MSDAEWRDGSNTPAPPHVKPRASKPATAELTAAEPAAATKRNASGAEADRSSDGATEHASRARCHPAAADTTGGTASDGAGFFSSTPKDTSFSAETFAGLGLSRPLLKACSTLNYSIPTPIQAACIPLALLGRDIVGSAITGSGKTAAFALPLLERLLFRPKRVLATHVLVLTPVRELAVQVHSMITKLAQFTDIRAALVVGGLSLQRQAAELRSAPEIVVATPGRVIDHVMNTLSFELDTLSALVLDEADRLLELGFQAEVRSSPLLFSVYMLRIPVGGLL